VQDGYVRHSHFVGFIFVYLHPIENEVTETKKGGGRRNQSETATMTRRSFCTHLPLEATLLPTLCDPFTSRRALLLACLLSFSNPAATGSPTAPAPAEASAAPESTEAVPTPSRARKGKGKGKGKRGGSPKKKSATAVGAAKQPAGASRGVSNPALPTGDKSASPGFAPAEAGATPAARIAGNDAPRSSPNAPGNGGGVSVNAQKSTAGTAGRSNSGVSPGKEGIVNQVVAATPTPSPQHSSGSLRARLDGVCVVSLCTSGGGGLETAQLY